MKGIVAACGTHIEADGKLLYEQYLPWDVLQKALALLGEHTVKCVVKNKTARKGMVELNCEIRLREDTTDFVNALSELDGVSSAVLVSYNGDYMG